MERPGFGAISAICIWLCSSVGYSADIGVMTRPDVRPASLSGGRTAPASREPVTVRLTGPFKRGDSDAMKQVLDRIKTEAPRLSAGPLATVELSSIGGDLTEGLKMGYLFRDYNVATLVRRKDICLSACALAFLGGTSSHDPSNRSMSHSLEVGARLGSLEAVRSGVTTLVDHHFLL